jgi:hypothetical protein
VLQRRRRQRIAPDRRGAERKPHLLEQRPDVLELVGFGECDCRRNVELRTGGRDDVRGVEEELHELSVSFLAAMNGCGETGAGAVKRPRAAASGKVEFDGTPIPAGSVVFLHVDSGIYSTCPISNGFYKSPRGDGPIEGKNVVSVIGLESEDGAPLWAGAWNREVEVQGSRFHEDIEVKSEEVKPHKEIDGFDEEQPIR